jgi:hypothetical protein
MSRKLVRIPAAVFSHWKKAEFNLYCENGKDGYVHIASAGDPVDLQLINQSYLYTERENLGEVLNMALALAYAALNSAGLDDKSREQMVNEMAQRLRKNKQS